MSNRWGLKSRLESSRITQNSSGLRLTIRGSKSMSVGRTFSSLETSWSPDPTISGVVQVKGRPDMTGQTQVAFQPAGNIPQPMPGYMPGGYPVQQGYGPPGYNPGYNPNPGYGMPMGPGYGQPMPGYGMPPQQQMPPQQVAQVRCKYCQGLMNQNSSNCPNCGAHQ